MKFMVIGPASVVYNAYTFKFWRDDVMRSYEFAIRMENLIEKLENLTGWIKALVVSVVSSGIGFFIWYVQSLPR